MAALGKTDEFELKSSLLHHIPKFHGMSMEDPNKHLKEFKVVCSSMTLVNFDGSILKMKAFPFSLLEKAKDWLYELAPGTVTSRESMKRAFFEKFFPTSRVILLRKRISGIQQNQGESFPTYYERFKTLVASCPQHQMKNELFLQYFYKELLPIKCQMLDAEGGALVDKTPMVAKALIANRALNAQQYEGVGQRDTPRQQVNEVSFTSNIQSQLANLTSIVSQMAEGMRMKEPSVCGVCSIQGHASETCLQLIENGGWESANAIGFQGQSQPRNDPYSNTYNPGARKSSQSNAKLRKKGGPNGEANWADCEVCRTVQRARFMQSNKEEAEKDILETFRKVQVNIPLLDSIKQVPRYAKFLKELCTTRKRISSNEVVKAMLDLGASINIMSYSIYASMHLGELKNDGVIIQLANHYNAYPKGVLEDVLVQVNHLIFSADFYVLEMDESDHSPTLPILLGQPFMKTAQTKIDVAKGSVTMAFGGDMISFNIPESVENTNDVRFCCAIDVIENIGQKRSTLIKKKVPRTTIEEEIGVNNKECTTTPLKTPILTESNPCAFVDSAATSLQHIGTSPNPISIPVSTNRLLPSMV
ncbi:unnamed protein product [Malus baccata var. baccata]